MTLPPIDPSGPDSERPRSTIDPVLRSGDDGCLKPVLVGCGTLAFFLAIALFVLVTKADDLLRWTLQTMESQIVSVLPEEIDPQRRERLDEAFAAAQEALASGRADAHDLQRFQAALLDYSRAAAEGVTADDVDRLIAALETLAGRQPSVSPPAPSDRSDETPSQIGPVALLAPPTGSR